VPGSRPTGKDVTVRKRVGAFAAAIIAAAILVASTAGSAVAAPVTPSAAITPQENRALLRQSDLALHYAHMTRTYTEDLGGGRRPTACQNPVDGTTASPKKAARHALLKEMAFPAGIMWQNTVFFYASPQAAQAAFREMARTAVASCNMSKVMNIGTDGDVVKARVTLKSTMLMPKQGISRLGVEYDTSLVSSSSVNPMYADSYDYSVYAVDQNFITRVGVVQIAPIEKVEYSDAETAVLAVAKRVARLGE
jgi:hypothetical protein